MGKVAEEWVFRGCDMDHQESWPFQVSPKTTSVWTLEYLCDGFNSMGIGVFRSFSDDMPDRRRRRRMDLEPHTGKRDQVLTSQYWNRSKNAWRDCYKFVQVTLRVTMSSCIYFDDV